MTWPTTISVQNVDAGIDNPRFARLDILESHQAVNSIVSEFGTVATSTPTQGNTLGYSGSQWEPRENFLDSQTIIQLSQTGGGYTPGGTSFSFTGSTTFTETTSLNELSDANSSFESPVVSAGTYFIEVSGYWASAVDVTNTLIPQYWTMLPSVVIRNETASTDLLTITSSTPPTELMDLEPDTGEVDWIHWASGAAQVTFAADSTISSTLKLAVTNTQGTQQTGVYWLGSHLLLTMTKI